MNKNGFTLIELLAVIVILSIILLIAIPAIGRVIESAKIGSFESHAKLIIKSAEFDFAAESVARTVTYLNGEVIGEDISYKGKRPENGKIVIREDGSIEIAIHDGTYCATKTRTGKVVVFESQLSDCKLPVSYASVTSGYNFSLLVSDEGDLYLNYLKGNDYVLDFFKNDLKPIVQDDKKEIDLFIIKGLLFANVFNSDQYEFGNYFSSEEKIDDFLNTNSYKNFSYIEYFHNGQFELPMGGPFGGMMFDSYRTNSGDSVGLEQYNNPDFEIKYQNDNAFKTYFDSKKIELKSFLQMGDSKEELANLYNLFYFIFKERHMGNFPFEDFVKSHLNDFAYLAMNVETPYWTTMWRVYEYDDFEQYMANEENAQNYSVLLDEIIEIANTLHPKEDMNSIKLSTPQDHAMYFNEKYVSEQFFDGNYPGFDLQMVIEYIFMNQSTWYNITPQMFENEVNSFEGFISTPAFITFEQEFMKVYSQKMYKVESNTVELNHSNIKDVKLFESDNYFTALLLKNDGTVYSIGSRPGLGGSEFNFDYADRFTKIEGIDNVKDIYMPDKNTIYFVTTDGDVYSYGDNSYKLGHGSAPGEYYKFSPTKITALSNIDKIYSGTTFSFFVSKSGSVFVSGNFGQSRSGHSTNYSINISNLELSMSKPVAAIYPLTNDSGVWNGYRFNSLIEYTDGTTELLIKNPNYYSYEPIAQAFIKESIDVSNISNVTTSKYNGLSILETKNGSLSAMGWNESSIFKNNNLDFYTSTFIPVDTASLKKIEVNQFDSVFLLTNDGHLKYTGRDLFPELTLPGTVLQSGQIYTNGLTKIISVKVKDFSVFGGKHPYDSQNLIIIDENNIIHNYGYITYNSGGD